MKRLFTKFLAMALTAAMLIELLPAANAVTTNAVTVDDGYADSHVVGEVNEERTETGKRFRLADGSYAAVEYGAPVHYADNDGNWQDIDNTLALQNADRAASVRTYESVNGTHEKDFAANLSNGFLFSSSSGERRVGMFLRDPLTAQSSISSERFNIATAQISYPADKQTVAVQSNRSSAETEKERLARETTPSRISAEVLYQNVFSNVDLQYEIFSYHVKESIVLNRKCDSYAFDFYLDLQGLTPALQDDGSVFLLDGEKIVYYLPAPYMFDDSGAESDAVSYTLSEQATGTWKLTVTADKGWIEAEDRAFPVTIDPTLIDNSSTSEFQGDTVASLTDEPVSNKNNIACGYHPTNGRMEAYFKLTDFPTVPEGCTLARAYVGLYQNDFRSSIGDGTGGKLCLYMQANTTYAPMNSSLTWATRPSYGEVLDYVDTDYWNVDSTVLWDITPAAKGWYDGTMPNYGLAMTSNGNTSTKCRAWFSYFRVSFIVSYRNVNGIEPYYTYQTLGLGNAGTAYLSDFTGQLTLAKTVCSYSSTVNPFSLSLYYNSGYAASGAAYHVPEKLGLNMRLGSGVGMNVVQKMEKVALQNDFSTGKTDTYLQYTDGDGTVHYFAKDGNDWKDEDGLGLKATEYSAGSFRVTDDNGNRMDFAGGYLSLLRDANGNEIQILYSSKQITSVVQKNKGGSAITIATFTYDSSYYLTKITDAIGNEYTPGYTNGMLTSLKRGGTTIAQYGMGSDRRMTYAYDAEAEYGVAFTYANKKISSYYEITSASTASRPGAVVAVSHPEDGRTIYRDYGADRTESSDDILTAYVFDYAGRTVNAYTTDPDHNILGASAAVYSGAGTTDKTNNRTLRTATLGAVEANLLRNGSFEFDAPAWTFQSGSGTLSAGSAGARTGQKGFVGSATADTTMTASFQTDNLSANRRYTLSGYVKTTSATGFLGDGIYLKVTAPSGTAWTSEKLNVKTSSGIDSGWTRLSVNFTAPATGSYTVSVVADGLTGSFYADDLQLEQGETPSTLNLLRNADMQVENDGWSLHTRAAFCNGIGLPQEVSGAYSLRIYGDAYTNCEAYQEVAINLPGTQTYVLSGWAKALSLPDNVKKNDDPAQDLEKQFGLRAILTYTDGSTEYHYTAFNPDVRGWQFASCTIVPKQTGKTVRTIRVVCAYEKNCNTAYFDNLSLTREVAQTMHYDADGNLVSVKSTGKKEETAAFENGNLISVNTGGSGTFTYTYDGNHNVTRASNGVIRQDYTYDSMGNVTGTSLKADSGSGSALTSSATYTNGGNLLASATDARGNSTAYAYTTNQNKAAGVPSAVTDAKNVTKYQNYDFSTGRMTGQGIDGVADVSYTYDEHGQLEELARSGHYGSEAMSQSYGFTYDTFGNILSTTVGDRTLASYTYAQKNGLLSRMTYGNGDYINYAYDRLGRTTEKEIVSGSSTRKINYVYNGDGQLHSVKDGSTAYGYTYDTLGRLVGTTLKNGTTLTQQSWRQFDDNNRLTGLNISIRGISSNLRESSTYNTQGVVTRQDMFSGEYIDLTYDSLSRLSRRDIAYALLEDFSYAPGVSANTTTALISEIQHKNKLDGAVLGSYQYTYDALGNISAVTRSGFGTTTYAYDTLNQLTSATTVSSSGTKQYSYTYDTFGNLRTASDDSTTHSYTYGDAEWRDLLTAYDGHAITYDAIGNPLTYHDGTSFVWKNGRQLTSLTRSGANTTYQYDLNGLRTRKSYPGVYTDYFWQDGRLIAEVVHLASANYRGEAHVFSYDESGAPIGIRIGSTDYYYGRNAQGDIEELYEWKVTPGGDEYAELVATYEYDPWGKLLAVKDADGNAITSSGHAAIKNPLRYRGYYYDIDSGFYYLQSRYYDPQIGRFINADEQIPTNDLSSLSLFAYCGNNPVNRLDPKGDAWWHWAVAAVAVVALVAASVVTCGGAAAAAGTAAAIVMGSCTAVPTSAAIITGAAVGASAAFAGSAAAAAASSKSLDEFAEQGETALANTTIGIAGGALAGYSNSVSYCFVAGTPVVAESGDVPIEQINVGDFVWAWDEASGDVALKRVVETYVNETDELTHVFVDGEEIIATPSHPFYCPTKGWTDASHLRAGDILVLVNGEYVVVEKVQHELLERPVKVYNFQVEDYHTYYVASGVLVHNDCRPKSPSKISDNKLKSIDVHAFKKEFVKGPVSHWDVYKDTANNAAIWLGDKAQKAWINTGLFLRQLKEYYEK